MENIEKIKKINKSIVHDDGTIDSFERQLINLSYGLYDMNYPMVISQDTYCLLYIEEIDGHKPLIINPYKVLKIKNEHDIGSAFVMDCYKMLNESLFSMDSLTQDTSKVVILDKFDDRDGSPILAICRYDTYRGNVDLNQITSIYGKQKFNQLILNSWNKDKVFSINNRHSKELLNKKIEQLAKHTRLQLPNCLAFALSDNYDKTSFKKSQVEAEYQHYLYSKYSVRSERKLPHLIDDIPEKDLEVLSKSSDWIIRCQVAKHKNVSTDVLKVLRYDEKEVIRNWATKKLISNRHISIYEVFPNALGHLDSEKLKANLDYNDIGNIDYNLELYFNKNDIKFDEGSGEPRSKSNDPAFSSIAVKWGTGVINTDTLIEKYKNMNKSLTR